MKHQIHFYLLSLLLVSFACQQKKKTIVNSQDYSQYMAIADQKLLNDCEEEMVFWSNRLKKNKDDEVSVLKLASLHAARFQLNGRVEELSTSDSLYKQVLSTTPFGKSEICQALAANCVTQHEFRNAKKYVEKALEIGDSKDGSYLMLTDIDLELGNYSEAKKTLKKFVNKNSFAFLIRAAKVKDYEGNLDSAILLMEKALDRIKESKSSFLWTKSNLADMYGHAGRVEDAYRAYLDVLKKEPGYDYALKGIAWVAYSHDHNLKEAKRIAEFLHSRKNLPDMHLLLAEIASFEGNVKEKETQLKLFTEKAREPKYRNMYDKYLAVLEAEDLSNPSAAIEIAKKEITNRPTPQSYDLLAWGYFRQGEKQKALEIAQQYVEGKTFEPEAIYHLGIIYKDIDRGKSHEYLAEAYQSSFELGPTTAAIIQKSLE